MDIRFKLSEQSKDELIDIILKKEERIKGKRRQSFNIFRVMTPRYFL